MTFTRTSTGLSNLYLFEKVDYVVFVEGGPLNLSYEQIEKGEGSSFAPDIAFWKAVLRSVLPRTDLRIKAVGSKSTLEVIAGKIAQGDISNVLVAMDRDHDSAGQRLIQTPGVFYSWGYSWESDVWSLQVVKCVLDILCPTDGIPDPVESVIEELYAQFCRSIYWPSYADALASLCDCAVIPRDAPQKVFSFAKKKPPAVKVEDLKRRVRAVRTSYSGEKLHLPAAHTHTVARCCPGKVIEQFVCGSITFLTMQHCGTPNMPHYALRAIAIDCFGRLLAEGQLPQSPSDYAAQEVA